MRVFEHCEACPAPCGGGTVTRSGLAHRDARSDHGYLTTDACEWPQCRCLSTVRRAPHHVGGGTVTRSMRQVANATLLRFDRYDEPPDLRTETPDPITDI
jgi:hypothetical protein